MSHEFLAGCENRQVRDAGTCCSTLNPQAFRRCLPGTRGFNGGGLQAAELAPRVVLLGDPQQLDQPMQGSHPEGTAVSAMDYLLAGQQTVPADRGLFLEETWRLHPRIAAFTSELFYDRRLRSRPGLERQSIIVSQEPHAGLIYLWCEPARHP